MNIDKDLKLSRILTDWYNINKRSLPWRDTTDPYIIWLSEIILQQTRVDQGYAYFMRFIEQYPTVKDLAEADEESILKLWQGLGYYSRARNLHAAARSIMDKHNGVFPSRYKDVLNLKGVGEYTAAAITSFAYSQPYAVVDGNVYRVLSRIFAIDEPIDSTKGKKLFAELAQELLDGKNPGLHNQAIMEFGALQCVPVSPDCNNCPASGLCLAHANNTVSRYPRKQGKTKTRNRYFHYFDIQQGEYTYIRKRTGKDIWQNLYEFPLIETTAPTDISEIKENALFKDLFEGTTIELIRLTASTKHILSHQIIYASFYQITLSGNLPDGYEKIAIEDIDKYPVSRLVHKYLENK